jgi:hypothetical protein
MRLRIRKKRNYEIKEIQRQLLMWYKYRNFYTTQSAVAAYNWVRY